MREKSDFQKEVDNELKETGYVGRRVIIRVIIIFVIIAAIVGVGGVIYTYTIQKAQTNAEREVFKNTVAYTEQMSSFLAKSYKEYNDAETDSDKSAIMEYVVMRYPNIDTSSIDNATLKQFYNQCLKGE